MTAPQPSGPPLTGSVCESWAQASELSQDAQELHSQGMWCSILSLASDILWAASGRRWRNVQATETVTLDPPEQSCQPTGQGYAQGYWRPMLVSPSRPNRVRLPRPDVTAITTVTLDGSAFTAYRRSGSYALRTDGHGWPLATTTRITYQFGRLVPHSGRLACAAFAGELGKALLGQRCGLPARVTSVTRQGISFDVLESLEFLKEGLTGFPPVDMWIRSVNPTQTRGSGQVWSPDVVEARPV